MPLYRRLEKRRADHGLQMRGIRRGLDLRAFAQAAEPVTEVKEGFQVNYRLLVSVGGVALAVMLSATMPAAGQAPAAAAATNGTYIAPRTPDGQPDLQGFWTNTTYTPLERPKDVTKEFYTSEEALERFKQLAAEETEQTEPGTIADVHYDFTQFGLDRNQGGMALNLRTSLIVDPADGRIPPMTAEGQKRTAARAEARQANGCCNGRRAEPVAQRALHHHGPRRAADAARRLQQQLSDRPDSWLRDDSRRDDP